MQHPNLLCKTNRLFGARGVLGTRHPSPRKNHTHTYLLKHNALAVCETELRSPTSATAAETAAEAAVVTYRRRRQQCTCQIFKNKGKRENKTYIPIQNKTTLQKSEAK